MQYVIYQFLAFCISVLGKGNRSHVVDLLSKHADHLTPPFSLTAIFQLCGCCVPEPYENNRALADAILLQCQVFALQFVFFRPVTTTAMVVMKQIGYYGAGTGPTDYRSPQFYLVIIQNVSIFVAFAGLLKFYHAVQDELAWCRPFAKFMCIKGVVFMTFWQGLAISILAQTTDVGGEDSEEWAQSAQNFLICLEMLLFSIAHFYCFPTEEWQEGYRVKHERGQFGDSMALGDFFSDIKLILSATSDTKRKKTTGAKKSSPPSIPEVDEENAASDDSESGHEVQTVVSAGTANTENDESEVTSIVSHEEDSQRAIARALEESLGIVGNDPDIVLATQRLLDSKILRPEFFHLDEGDIAYDSEDGFCEHEPGSARNGHDESGHDESAHRAVVMGVLDNRQSIQSESPPSETTSLWTFDAVAETLRPSIFTTVASIAEAERLRGNG
jgi:hypothetical protein